MSLIKWVLLLLVLTAQAHASSRLKPFTPTYDYGRSAEETFSVLKNNPQRWVDFTNELARLAGLPVDEQSHKPQPDIERMLNDGEYDELDCRTTRCMMITSGIYPSGKIGYVRRFSKPGERVACLKSSGTTCFSYICGNPSYVFRSLPPLPPPIAEELWERVYVCWQGPTIYTHENSTMLMPSGIPFAGVTGASSNALAAANAGSSTQVHVSGSSASIVSNTGVSAASSALASGSTVVGGWGLSSPIVITTNAITIGHPNAGCGYVLQPTEIRTRK
jgi:hypothetical protein